MTNHPPSTPDSDISSEQLSHPQRYVSIKAAISSGIRRGAKYGVIIAGGLALLVGSTVIIIAYSLTQQRESILFAILGVSLGVVIYAICGAIVGAVVIGVVAASRFRHRSRLQTILRVILAIAVFAVLGVAIGFTIYWCSLPGMRTENHVFFFLNLCHKDKYEDAARYLERHPEIVTDDRAINHEPALLAVAFFDGDPRTTQLLLDHGANVNATDAVGTTALEVAIKNGNLRVAKLLLERGAIPGPRCKITDANALKAIIEAELAKRAKGENQKKGHRW
jgi:hypothetical protein